MDDRDRISLIIQECRRAYEESDRTGYSRVSDMLQPLPRTAPVTKAISLANAGPTLSSPRFAYPHIISALSE